MGPRHEGRVSLALGCWKKIRGIEICLRLKIGLSFHVTGLSDDEGTSCGAEFWILSPADFTAATLALGLCRLVRSYPPAQLFFVNLHTLASGFALGVPILHPLATRHYVLLDATTQKPYVRDRGSGAQKC